VCPHLATTVDTKRLERSNYEALYLSNSASINFERHRTMVRNGVSSAHLVEGRFAEQAEGKKLTTDYEALRGFITSVILAKKLEVNSVESIYPVVESLTAQFDQLGWGVEKLPTGADKTPLHRLTSPDGAYKLAMRGGKVFRHSATTEVICKHKDLTKLMLDLVDVPAPRGAHFLPSQRDIALAYFRKMPKPVVVKPTDAAGSHGVTVGIRDEKNFVAAWDNALSGGRKNSNILIEQFAYGIELRAYVVGDTAVSVIARLQPFIAGDGARTVSELIQNTRDENSVHVRARRNPMKVEWRFVNQQGHDKHSVPTVNEVVFLNQLSTVRVGALTVDVTKFLSPDILNMAVRAKNAVPELEVAGVDMLVEDLSDANTAHVVEVNTAASPDLHRYTHYGETRAVDTDVVQYFHHQYLTSFK